MSIADNKIEKTSNSHQVILFDGNCLFCNWSVNYILKRDTHKKFYFSSLQSKSAIEYLSYQENSIQNLDSILLVDKNTIHIKSSAALRIANQLTGLSKLLFAFIIIPKTIRDWVYDFIAKRRQLFFKTKNCKIPSSEEKKRFIS
jgi:predicted DCC family thiol-disulfide oxidoreductase YuxK